VKGRISEFSPVALGLVELNSTAYFKDFISLEPGHNLTLMHD